MSDEPTPDVINELDTPGPLKVMSPRIAARMPLSPVLGMSEGALAAIPRRRQRPSLEAGAQSARGVETVLSSRRANAGETGSTKPRQDPIHPPRVTEGATNERPIEKLYRDCTDAVQQFENSKERRTHLLIQCLQKSALLYEHGQSRDPDGYARLLARHEIRVTGRTHNPFSPVVKLVFSGVDKAQRTNLSRYAGVLRFAHENGVEPDAFSQLLKEERGLDGCAERDREAHPSPERQAAASKRAAHLQALREQAYGMDLAGVADELPRGLTAVLIEKDQHGTMRVLGVRTETFQNVRRYSPLPSPLPQEQ